MSSEVVDLLERQCAFLARQEQPGDFLVQVEPFLSALRAEPRMAVHMDDLRLEVLDQVRVMEAVEEELLPELQVLRKTLADLRPELDDSNQERPDSRTPDMASW